ncbi:MAG: UDP binding domain-containing protein, partial [Sphingomicrobium sp.]
ILSGRRVNDGMGAYIAQRLVKLLACNNLPVRNARVGILGFTFKENVPDIRNSKVVDIYRELRAFGLAPIVHDPLADADAVRAAYGVELSPLDEFRDLNVLIVAVSHEDYVARGGEQLGAMVAPGGIFADLKANFDPVALRPDLTYWSL